MARVDTPSFTVEEQRAMALANLKRKTVAELNELLEKRRKGLGDSQISVKNIEAEIASRNETN